MEYKECKAKAEILDELWLKIQRVIEDNKITQVKLWRMCQDRGYQISQPEISKVYTGRQRMTLYQFVAFSDVLHISADEMLGLNSNESKSHILQFSGNSFITDPYDDAFRGYLGRYYTVFQSTNPFESRLLYGRMDFKPSEDGQACTAAFVLDTGERDSRGNRLVKKYYGQVVISARLPVLYVLLTNQKIGELSVIEIRFRNFFIQENQCRLGLFLTCSSGENKAPVFQKMFISRDKLEGKMAEWIEPMLKLNGGEILISEEGLKDLIDSQPEIGFDFKRLLDLESENVYYIDEHELRRINKRISRQEMAQVLSKLKAFSEEKSLIGLTESEDNISYELYRKSKEELAE